MIIYGYAKSHIYAGDGTLMIKTRIPSIHGPMTQAEYRGNPVRNYTYDDDLPYYPATLLPHMPVEGEVVSLMSMNSKSSKFMIVGLTGGSYYNGNNLER